MVDGNEETDQLRQRIAQRAYQLYAARGYLDGYDVQDWLEAEKEIQVESHVANPEEMERSVKVPFFKA
jgi:Protein of unknown function (DUF2934)